MDSRVEELIRRHERLKSERSIWDSHWNEIAERIWPDRALFMQKKNTTPGEKKTEKVFDLTGNLALTRFSAAVESYITPRTQKWHRLKTSNEELNENPAVQAYLDEVTNILFRMRYSSQANFASQINEAYTSIGAFGTGGILVEDMLGTGIRYKSCDLANLYLCENHHGMVDTVHREFVYTARQAMQHFGETNLPPKIRDAYGKNPDQEFTFVHCVQPNEERKANRSYHGMQYASWYVAVTEKAIVQEGGYRTFPYSIGRYITSPGEVYGRGPVMIALPAIKTLNEMKKTVLRAGHLAVSPPLMLQEDGALNAFSMQPGALNYGGVDDQGRPTVHALQVAARLDIGLEMMQAEQKSINEALLVSLFQILIEDPGPQTATEAMIRNQEKAALLAPTMGRQQSEMIGPTITREIDILAHAGVLPPMPQELLDIGGEVEIEYVGPLNRAQRAEDGVAIMRTAEAVGVIAQYDARVIKAYDWLKAVQELGDINGVPAKLKVSEEQIQAKEQQEAQQQQLAALLEAAPIAADTAHTMAQTGQIASQGAPAVMPG